MQFKELKCAHCGSLICYYYGWNDGDIVPFCIQCKNNGHPVCKCKTCPEYDI